MRRKSDRTKEKEKSSPEKKTEKAMRRSRRHSKRRKRSSSVSEHDESAPEDNETSLKTHGDTEEEPKSGGFEEDVDQDHTDAKEKDAEGETSKCSTSRRSSKKQTTDEMGGSKSQACCSSDADWKEDKSFWEAEEGKSEMSEPRHKEKDGKSSLWQVKTSNGAGSNGGGEIKKIKLCIVRPSETSSEPCPRRRKRLSRTMTSHKDKSDTQECEEADEDHGEDDKKVLELSDGKQNSKQSYKTTGTKSLHDEGKVSEQENTEQRDVSEERSQQGQNSSPDREQASLQSQDQIEAADETVDQESTGDKQNVHDSDVKEDKLVQESSDMRADTSPETSGEHHKVGKSCDRTEHSDVTLEDRVDDQAQLEEHVEQKEVGVEESCEGKDMNCVASEEQAVVTEEKPEPHKAAEVTSQAESQNIEDSQEERLEGSDVTVQISKADNDEDTNDKNTACAATDQDTTLIERAETSTEVLIESSSSEEGQKGKVSLEGRPEEPEQVAEEVDAVEEGLVAHISSERTKGERAVEEGQIQDSSEECSASREVSRSDVSVNDVQVKESTKHSSRDRSNKRTTIKRVFLKESSHSRDSSEERPRDEVKKRRQSRESNSSRSFSPSPGKQIHRRADRESTHRNRIQGNEHSDKHSKKRDNNRNSSSDRQGSRHSHRRSRSPQNRREKISLRRSFSKQSNSHGREKNAIKESVKKVEASADESHPHIRDDKNKENVRKTTEQTGTSQESSQSVTRRRRWGAGKTNRAGKKPVLSISTDSLKNLIPGAKPVPVNEVQLSQDEEEEEEERREKESEEHERDENDTSEKSKNKDKDEDNQEALDRRPVAPMFVSEPHKISVAVTDDYRSKVVTRKISIVSDDARTLQNSPSPPRHKESNVLFITNLVRPFTVNQLKELLARTGTIVEGGFWIDKIKSKCYVQYETETEARETRHALHGVRWPVSNPKQLCVDFGRKEDMDLAQALTDDDQIPRKTEPLKVERTIEGWVAEQAREKERERELREHERERERERTRTKERHHAIPAVEPLERNRNVKMSANVREWDLGKIGQLSPAEKEPKHEEKNKERERKVRREKAHHSRSPSPHDIPVRKQKKKEDDAPAKLLDDLFRKTKCTPCIYWLPLTAEQIVVKEEMRRRHMAEHERRMAEMRKAERERERARAQQRQQRRAGERDKRRRRTASGSPKK